MFATVPVHNAGSSEEQIIRPDAIRRITPHADVMVGEVSTPCCEAFFDAADSVVILLDLATMKTHLQALTGEIDEMGQIS